MSTKIQWTDVTDNIIVAKGGGWWCRKISPGCAHCYAEKLNGNSFFGGNHLPYSGQPPEMVLRREILAGWKKMRTPRRHFVSSMTDVFGEWVPRSWIFEFLNAMEAAPLQTFQVLTKRAAVMEREFNAWLMADARGVNRGQPAPANIWLGVSVENQATAALRIPLLLKTNCAVRFLSCEPLLEEIDLMKWIGDHDDSPMNWGDIQWLIIGGESGAGARPCNVEWIRSLVQQGKAAGVALFVKQVGSRCHGNPWFNGKNFVTCVNDLWYPEDKKGGDMDEWPADLQVREFPK